MYFKRSALSEFSYPTEIIKSKSLHKHTDYEPHINQPQKVIKTLKGIVGTITNFHLHVYESINLTRIIMYSPYSVTFKNPLLLTAKDFFY